MMFRLITTRLEAWACSLYIRPAGAVMYKGNQPNMVEITTAGIQFHIYPVNTKYKKKLLYKGDFISNTSMDHGLFTFICPRLVTWVLLLVL